MFRSVIHFCIWGNSSKQFLLGAVEKPFGAAPCSFLSHLGKQNWSFSLFCRIPSKASSGIQRCEMCKQQEDTFVYPAAATSWDGFARSESYREIKNAEIFNTAQSGFLKHVAISNAHQPNRAIRHTTGNNAFYQALIRNGMKTLPDNLNLCSGIWGHWRNTVCEQPLGGGGGRCKSSIYGT